MNCAVDLTSCSKAVCDELTNQKNAVEETLTERTAVKHKQENKLTDLKSETLQVKTEISEKDQLMLCHVETQERLTMQADALLRTAVNSTSDLELLHDKIERTRIAVQCNELTIKQFENQNKEMYGSKILILLLIDFCICSFF